MKIRKALENSVKTLGPEETKKMLLKVLEEIIDEAIKSKVKTKV